MPLSHAPSRRNNIRLEPVRPGRIPPSLSRHESVITTTTGTESLGSRTGDFALLPSSPPSEFGTFTGTTHTLVLKRARLLIANILQTLLPLQV